MATEDTLPEQQRQQLQNWLALYALDRHLREPEDPEPRRCTKAVPLQAQLANAAQVRLLAPAREPIPGIERPVYVLLVPGPRDSTTVLIPFSRFEIPATPQEWRTGLARKPLQVLCLWNARTLPTTACKATWLVKDMPPRAYRLALAAYRKLHAPDTWCPKRFGPPLRHPLDPRHTYLQEEGILLDALLMDLQATGHEKNTIPYSIPQPDTRMLRAADPPAYPDRRDGSGQDQGPPPPGDAS